MTPNMGSDMAKIREAIEEEQQDEQKIADLLQDFNNHEDYRVMVLTVRNPESGRIEIIPMEK